MSSCNCPSCGALAALCGCCEGVSRTTPVLYANRPGLAALRYRVGRRAQFFETMKARLSSVSVELADGSSDRPLLALTTRETDDPSIALLDAWATLGDVLGFYQERIANEGYLRTATERRSVIELARLVGYAPRPGVAASTFLAFTVDPNTKGPVLVPRGTRAQSIPGPGQKPQVFETSDDVTARADWNVLLPRPSKPKLFTLLTALRAEEVLLQGTTSGLKPGDKLLFVFGSEPCERLIRDVKSIEPDEQAKRTKVLLRPLPELFTAVAPVALALAQLQIEPQGADGSPERLLSDQSSELVAYLAFILDQSMLGERKGYDVFAGLLLLVFKPLTLELVTHARLFAAIAVAQAATPPAAGVEDWLAALLGSQSATLPTLVAALADDSFFEQRIVSFLLLLTRELTPRTSGEAKALRELISQELAHAKTVASAKAATLLGLWGVARRALGATGALRPALELAVARLLPAFAKLLRQPALSAAVRSLAAALLEANVDDSTKLELEQLFGPVAGLPVSGLGGIVTALETAPSAQPRHASELVRDPRQAFTESADGSLQLLLSFQPGLKDTLYPTWGSASISTARSELQALYALRLTAPAFGNNAGPQVTVTTPKNADGIVTSQSVSQQAWRLADDERTDNVFLDNEYRSLEAGSYALLQSPTDPDAHAAHAVAEHGQPVSALFDPKVLDALRRLHLLRATTVEIVQRSEYGLNGKSTRLDLEADWRVVSVSKGDGVGGNATDWSLRHALVYTQSEALALAEEPLSAPICQASSIELDRLVDGLGAGRWLIVSGERSDLGADSGVITSELCMLAASTQQGDSTLPGEKPHTMLSFAAPLAFCYKRSTLSIWGNVAKATNGESRAEVLGAGDGTQERQKFALKQPPLTYVPARSESGAESTLRVFVNEVEWHSSDFLADAGPTDRVFLTRIDDDGKTSVIFGDGHQGARLPSGQDNVRAEYRNGIGRGGNVDALQVSTLITRPLGLREVVNPLPASGGAEPESRDQARRNAPLSVRTLERLVSVPDYADFSRRFAGIGKASAVELSDGRRQLVHVTIAGVDDIPILETSELFKDLQGALVALGDPLQPIELALRERLTLVIGANVRPLPDYVWLDLSQRIRARLLEVFGFEQRELGQSVTSSEVLSVIQRVRGVAYVDLDVLDALSEAQVLELLETGGPSTLQASLTSVQQPRDRVTALGARPDEQASHGIAPSQLVYLSADVADTLTLNLIPDAS